jgi:valyl-tRNA synthetase
MLQGEAGALAALARLDPGGLSIERNLKEPPLKSVPLVVGPLQAYLPLAGMVDLNQERARLAREWDQVRAQIARLQGLLAGPFAERAPAEVVQGERDKLEALEGAAARLQGEIEALG